MDLGAEADDAPTVFLAAPLGCSSGLGCSRIHQELQLRGATDASYKVQQGKESHLQGSWGCGYRGWIISTYPAQPIIC